MSTPEQRGFDDQYDINGSQTLRDGITVACDNNGQCQNNVKDGFPYVEGTTMPCSFANCGIPPQPFDDQKAAMMQGEYNSHSMQLADRVANGVVATGYEYFEDPYYMEAVEDGKVLAGSFPERHLVLQDDFNNDSIVATKAMDQPITHVEAADKFIASESVRRNPAPVAGTKDALLAQQGSQTTAYKKSMMIGGAILGAGAIAVLGYYGYKKYKARQVAF